MNFSGNQVVVTGGANGIGRCIAETFLSAGAQVVIIDTDKKAGQSLQSHFSQLRFYRADIAEKDALDAFVGTLSYPVDILVNNACVGRAGLLSGCTWEDFEYVQRVSVTAPYYLTSLLLQRNLLAPGASIVNIASTRAFQSQPDTESYSAAKGGIAALTHAMAVSFAGRARVNCISPGWIDTAQYHEGATLPEHNTPDKAQHPAGRVGNPEDIASMALYLCGGHASFITGENIAVDGGMSKLMIYHGDSGWEFNA